MNLLVQPDLFRFDIFKDYFALAGMDKSLEDGQTEKFFPSCIL